MRISDWSSDVCSSDLAGGHLTHGAPPAQSGKWFNAVQYGVRPDDHLVDFDQVEALARDHRPALIIAGGSAYPRTLDFARFRAIADDVGALLMVDMAHFAGLVAGGAHRSEEHTSELQSLMRISYAVFCLKNKTKKY